METNQTDGGRRPEVVPGDRIFLSVLQRSDLLLFARWFSDLELTLYVGQPGMANTLEQEEEWYERAARQRDAKTFAIIVRDGQQMIGTVSLTDIDQRRQRAALGIAIGDKGAWNKGYGSEAVRLMCAYGFAFLNLYSVYLWVLGYNLRAHQAYLKSGFREVGRLRGGILFDGRRYEDILMEITRDEFGPSNLTHLIQQIAS
ncbi:GNAT family N-acetyltransferase [Roseiflexus sp.]|uniref:GNAT family N-acetyltransferase n=1 Tax=Roseiflexus sp. TaxID=2562120 RepID=UPI0021DB9FF5|nr:GNAT family protein [Roseiflexus sp.]GIW01392.1 MAG: N-acetyltransferase [Roseiflexus sp.]